MKSTAQKIIHVDNSEFFRKLVKNTLIEAGYSVESTESGTTALAAAAAGEAAAIIMGLTFQDMSGEDLLKKLLALPKKTPVIVLTANDDADEKERFLRMGFSAYISKSGNWQEALLKEMQLLPH